MFIDFFTLNKFTVRYLYNISKKNLIESKLESGKRESREIGKLLELQLTDGISNEKVIQNLQNSISNTDTQSEFICMYNTDGIELCHPNPSLIGQKIEVGNSKFISENKAIKNINEILNSGKLNSGIRKFPNGFNRSSEIVSVYPIKGTNWMLASHTNIAVLSQEISNLYFQFLLTFLLSSLLLLLVSFFIIKFIYKKYEKLNEEHINQLNNDIIGLTALNQQLKLQQEKSISITDENTKNEIQKRINIYHKDELIPIETSDIAYFSIKENNVFLITFKNQNYSTNTSLDEFMKILDLNIFYRANRQYIININAINTILIYGNNQLKLLTNPIISEGIIISKNKVAEFKKWLEQ